MTGMNTWRDSGGEGGQEKRGGNLERKGWWEKGREDGLMDGGIEGEGGGGISGRDKGRERYRYIDI